MAFTTQALTSDWWSPSDFADPDRPFFEVTGTGAVEYVWTLAAPVAATAGASIAAGLYNLIAPIDGQRIYFRKTSGSASVVYAASVGAQFDTAACGYAWSGDAGADEDFAGPSVQFGVGFDDQTVRSGDNPYEQAAYLSTVAAGLAAGDSVDNAWLTIPWICRRAGRTLRIYGLEYATSQFALIDDWDELVALTKTAAYAEVTTSGEPYLRVEVTSIIEELQGVTSWATTSPIQLYIEDTGSALTGENTMVDLILNGRVPRVAIMLTGGGNPTPGAGIGGP